MEMRISLQVIAMVQASDKGGLNRGSGSRDGKNWTNLRGIWEAELMTLGVC